jgi:hypothetical protein
MSRRRRSAAPRSVSSFMAETVMAAPAVAPLCGVAQSFFIWNRVSGGGDGCFSGESAEDRGDERFRCPRAALRQVDAKTSTGYWAKRWGLWYPRGAPRLTATCKPARATFPRDVAETVLCPSSPASSRSAPYLISRRARRASFR